MRFLKMKDSPSRNSLDEVVGAGAIMVIVLASIAAVVENTTRVIEIAALVNASKLRLRGAAPPPPVNP
jgi:hypothetical protein